MVAVAEIARIKGALEALSAVVESLDVLGASAHPHTIAEVSAPQVEGEGEGELVSVPADDPLIVYVSPKTRVEQTAGGGCTCCGLRVAVPDGSKFARLCVRQGPGGVSLAHLGFVCFSCAQKHARALFRTVIRGSAMYGTFYSEQIKRHASSACTRCRELGQKVDATSIFGVADSPHSGLGMELCAEHTREFALLADAYRKGAQIAALRTQERRG